MKAEEPHDEEDSCEQGIIRSGRRRHEVGEMSEPKRRFAGDRKTPTTVSPREHAMNEGVSAKSVPLREEGTEEEGEPRKKLLDGPDAARMSVSNVVTQSDESRTKGETV
jgi:hypothetical protein